LAPTAAGIGLCFGLSSETGKAHKTGMNHGNVTPAIAKGLLSLKKRIKDSKIPSSKVDETLNIATWNIREFGKSPREPASIHYIAEVLGQFDLIGIVELRENLEELGQVLDILGSDWRAVYSDAIRDYGGNWERVAYIYDHRLVRFNGLAAEAQAPRKKQGFEYLPKKSFWRSPYMASFSSGLFDFVVLTTHIRWGDNDTARVEELAMLADWVEAKRQEKYAEDVDLLVMGDFNIPAIGDKFFEAITKHGLEMPTGLQGLTHGTNLAKDKRYDQILHYPTYPKNFADKGGALDFFIDDAHIPELYSQGMSRDQFTFQMSDHLPLWMQVRTDIEGMKLDQIIKGK
jgi:endonuclease/exonuclease/phosphatase family metal-dependent hydrolase